MTYDEAVKKFLKQVEAIKKTNPTYRQPGDGSDGTCDCIGLIIGAIRRMGLKWTGIHGSNWAARKEFTELKQITKASDLKVGDVVLKAYEKGSSAWSLPKRYQKGGAYYNGDLKDYYHAGVVTSVSPLKITHMTSPTVKVDTSLGKWSHYGQLKILVNASTSGSSSGASDTKISAPVSGTPSESDLTVIPSTGTTAVVWAQSGRYVKMRQQPSTKCKVYEEIPIGAKVTLEAPGEEWARISYGRRKNWYMMAKFLLVEKENET